MPKLTDTQLMLLSGATQRDGVVILPAKLKGGAAAKVVKPLLALGLVKEVPSKPDTPAWRRDEAEGQSYALVITRAGRKAINIEPDDSAASERPDNPSAPSPKASRPRDGAPRPGSKLARAVDMLTARGGTTIAALVEATGWLPHTTRAVLTGLRKRGYRIEKEPAAEGHTAYRIANDCAPGSAHRKSKRRKR
jgi:hypothetical protein